MEWRRLLLVCAVLAGVALFLWWGMGGVAFLSDDAALLDWGRAMVTRDFFGPWLGGGLERGAPGPLYYRPLTILSHGVDWLVWGYHPAGHRALNVALHFACSVLVYLVARRLMRGAGSAAVLAALVFALHPSHELTVWWIACRMELLCALFYLLSVLLFLRHLDGGGWRWLAGSTAFGALALCSKEMAYSLPLVLGALAFARPGGVGERLRRGILAAAPMGIVAAAFLGLRLVTMPAAGTLFALQVDAAHLKTVLYLAARHFVFPYHVSLRELAGAHPWAGVALLLFVAAVVAARWRRLPAWPVLAAAGWTVLTFLPIIRTMNAWTLYLPSVGFALAAGWLLQPERNWRGVLAGVLAAGLLVSYAAHFQMRKADWHYADRVARGFLKDYGELAAADKGARPILVTAPAMVAGIPVYMHYVERHLRQALGDDTVAPLVLGHVVLPEVADDGGFTIRRAGNVFDIFPEKRAVFVFPEKGEWSYAYPVFQAESPIALPWGRFVLHGGNDDKSVTPATAVVDAGAVPGAAVYYYAQCHVRRLGD